MEPTRPPIAPPEVPTFTRELEALLNKYSKDNETMTPDFILVLYIVGCLDAFKEATHKRDRWFNAKLTPPPVGEPPIKGRIE